MWQQAIEARITLSDIHQGRKKKKMALTAPALASTTSVPAF